MNTYNYLEAITADAIDYIKENYSQEEITEKMEERDEWEQELYDDMWIADSVTGNASGSYYCNAYRAAEAIAHNWDVLHDALWEFGYSDCNPIEKGEEWCDVTIRCYLLGQAISGALDQIESEAEQC